MVMKALVNPQDQVIRRDANIRDGTPTKPGFRWLPVEVTGTGPVDPATQIMEGPVTTVEANRVLDTFTIRNKTSQELDAMKDARIDSLSRDDLITIFHHIHNRIRDLEANVTISTNPVDHTKAQVRNSLKNLLS